MRGHSTTCWSLVRGWHSFHRRHHCLVALEPSWCNCPQLKVFYYSSTPKYPLPVCRTKRSSNFLKKNDMDQSYACNMCLLNCWYFWGIYWQFIFHLDLRRQEKGHPSPIILIFPSNNSFCFTEWELVPDNVLTFLRERCSARETIRYWARVFLVLREVLIGLIVV